MKVLFLATPDFAIKFLERIIKLHNVALVITRPDSPRGRGQKLKPLRVKDYCIENGLKVSTPQNPDEILPLIKDINPDIAVTVAYGRILSRDFFSAPKFGTLNVHFSLLPKYRGAAPIQWSLINGEKTTGVTIFEIDKGLDSGQIYKQTQIAIEPQDNAVTLCKKLVDCGIEILMQTLSEIKNGTAKKILQKAEPTFARTLTKKDALIDFNQSSEQIHNLIRGLAMGPYAYVISRIKGRDMRIQIMETSLYKGNAGENLPHGSIACVESNIGFLVQCHNSLIMVKKVRPEGKRIISALDFINGFNLKKGDFFAKKENFR